MRSVFAMLAAMSAFSTSVDAQDNAARAGQMSAAINPKVVEWRRDFHAHPELGNRETRTAKVVADHLRALGLEVRTGIAVTGVVGVLKGGKPGPRIALRADMDALPVTERSNLPFASKATTTFRGETVGVMHACGHDAHTSILMGVAEALAGMRRDLPGEVMFIFQPAEEGAPEGETGGASRMLEEGLFDSFKPEAVFGLHVWSNEPVGEIGYRTGSLMAASDSFKIIVKGKQTHGARPWGGVDPIVAAADIIGTAQSIVSRRMDITKHPVVLSFGAIKGGIRFNIIPDQVELIGTIRTFDAAMRAQVFSELRRVAERIAQAHGATVETQIPDRPGTPMVTNDAALVARVLPSLQQAVGADNVKQVAVTTAAEDFSRFGEHAPSLFFFVGSTAKGIDPASAPSNHSPLFILDEGALAVGTRTLLQVSLDYLNGVGAVPE